MLSKRLLGTVYVVQSEVEMIMIKDRLIKTCLAVIPDEQSHYAISPEIAMTSSFYSKSYEAYVAASKDEFNNYVYTRGSNPTTHKLEVLLAELEGAQRCKVFASGMGAISATLQSYVMNGSHIVVVNSIYSTAMKFIKSLEKFGVSHTVVMSVDTQEIVSAIQDNTDVIYLESPSSQKFEIVDLKAIADIAKSRQITTMIDNTWATPMFQRPLESGIDLILHSCSKYIGGHSDIVAGAVLGTTEGVGKVEQNGYLMMGSTCSPMNSFLAIRGIRTLPIRMEKHNSNVKAVIDALKDDPRIEKIYHPYIQQAERSEKYLDGYGSLLAITFTDKDTTKLQTFINTLETFLIGVSWGGYESMVLPGYKFDNLETMKARGLDITHTRLFIGLLEAQMTITDLKQALSIAYD